MITGIFDSMSSTKQNPYGAILVKNLTQKSFRNMSATKNEANHEQQTEIREASISKWWVSVSLI